MDGYAAVLRVGLGPIPPPLCRYALHTQRQGRDQGRNESKTTQTQSDCTIVQSLFEKKSINTPEALLNIA